MKIQGFEPVAAPGATTLILGSMPSKQSLLVREYYANPRNAFWRIIQDTCRISLDLPYAARTAALAARGIALWDVLQSCTRESSLDSDIVESSIVVNDFATFFRKHPSVATVFFNGAKAQAVFLRRVYPDMPPDIGAMSCTRLPSTSPANAAMPFEAKIEAWRAICSKDRIKMDLPRQPTR